MPDADSDTPKGARDAGIDPVVLDRLLSSIEPEDHDTIRTLAAQDLEKTRAGIAEALSEWDPDALARHLHVMSSLARTVGADALADEAERMQARLRSGVTSGYEESAGRMDELALSAARYLAECGE